MEFVIVVTPVSVVVDDPKRDERYTHPEYPFPLADFTYPPM
jgi:hypothetical protein